MFTEVFETSINTMLMCYLTDCENNNGKPMFAHKKMIEFIDKHGKLDIKHVVNEIESTSNHGYDMISANATSTNL